MALRRLATAACLAALTASAAMAQGSGGYVCKIQQKSLNEGWFAETVTIRYPVNLYEAVVKDAVIDRFVKQPMMATVDDDNAARITFVWSYLTRDMHNHNAQQKFRLTVMKSDLSALFTSSRKDNFRTKDFTATGKCTLLKG